MLLVRKNMNLLLSLYARSLPVTCSHPIGKLKRKRLRFFDLR